jgi:hypothetical protein
MQVITTLYAFVAILYVEAMGTICERWLARIKYRLEACATLLFGPNVAQGFQPVSGLSNFSMLPSQMSPIPNKSLEAYARLYGEMLQIITTLPVPVSED